MTGATVSGPIGIALAGATWAAAVRLRSPVLSATASKVSEAPVRSGTSVVMLTSTVNTGVPPASRSSTHWAP
jgi:hypothetical protein